MTRLFAVSLVLYALSLPGPRGTARADVVPLAERLAITSKTLDEERTYLVRTPRGYDPKESYPLLVLLDGIDHLGYVSGVADFLASNGRVPPMLIVAIENTNRARDLLQPSDDATTEGAEKFLAFIADELIPDVGTKYPLKPYRILVGHSNAGTFTVFSLLSKPDLFDAYVAISPFLWWKNESLLEAARPFLAEHKQLRVDLFFSVGDEDTDTVSSALKLAAMLEGNVNWEEQLKPRELRWTFRQYHGETHGSTGLSTIVEALPTIFEGWHVEDPFAVFDLGGVAALETHYQRVSERMGYEVRVPYSAFLTIQQTLVQRERREDAAAVVMSAIDTYPENANAHFVLATIHAQTNNKEKAIEQLKAALQINPNYVPAQRMLENYD